MNPTLFLLWMLISYTPTGPYVVERFKDFQDCERFRTRIEAEAATNGLKYHMKCESATIAR